MHEKRRFKKKNVNNSEVVIVGKDNLVVNGAYHEGYDGDSSSFIVQQSDSNSKFVKTWNSMDHKKYLNYRANGRAVEHNLVNGEETSFENCSMYNTISSTSEEPTDLVKRIITKKMRLFGPDYWNVLPKTDYTYSPSSPYYRTEVYPGIPTMPNLSRRPLRPEYTANFQMSNISEENRDYSFNKISARYVSQRRNAQIYKQTNRNRSNWIQQIFETIKTIIISSITTTVTSTIEMASHPMRKPYIIIPLIFLILTLLFCIPLYTETEAEEGVINKTAPWMPLAYFKTQNETSSLAASFTAIIIKPLAFIYNGVIASLQLLTTCLSMIPTILIQLEQSLWTSLSMIPAIFSQLVQLLYTFLNTIFQRIIACACSNPEGSILIPEESGFNFSKSVDNSPVIDRAERKTLLDDISELLKNTASTRENEKAMVLNVFLIKFQEILNSTINKHSHKVLDELLPLIKKIEDKVEQIYPGRDAEKGNSKSTTAVDGRTGETDIFRIVKSILKQYHADRTGMADYALLTNGGTISHVRCTQTYTEQSGGIYVFGIPIWNAENGPEVILKPGILPGECWPFEGSQGYISINLAVPIYVSGFTMEHTPKELTPFGNIKSAPYQFSVWAFTEKMDNNPESLGSFEFLDNGESLQYFKAEKLDKKVSLVELRIESNHGSEKYTCLYRFRVHGTPA